MNATAPSSSGIAGGLGIVMTDLFLSATAALLVVLAVANPTPPVPMPIQADLVATCPERNGGVVGHFILRSAAEPDGPTAVVSKPEDLSEAVSVAGLQAALFYSVALIPRVGTPVSAACLSRFTTDIIRAHNSGLSRAKAERGDLMAVFAVNTGVPNQIARAAPVGN